MGSLLKVLNARFDYVIIDSPPLLPVTDGAVLATLTDGAILIARHGKSSRDDLEQATHALEAVSAKLLGTVLNCIPVRASGYSYGYGYGYGYADESSRQKARSASKRPPARASRDVGERRRAANRHRETSPEDFKLDLRSYLESSRRD
jgi:Mrp family chromosome partitioning ATPase